MKKLLNHWNKAGAILLGLAIIGATIGGAGCAAYSGLIGHPLHVLHQQHETNEQAKQAKALGEAMYKDTHPQ